MHGESLLHVRPPCMLIYGQTFRKADKVVIVQGKLCCLDVGVNACLHDTLLMNGLQFTRTVLESDFGSPLCDVNFFASLDTASDGRKIFICL